MRGDLRDRRRDVGVGVKEDLDDPDAADRARLHVLDVVDRRRVPALGDERDAPLDLLRGQAGVVPHHETRLNAATVYGRSSARRTIHIVAEEDACAA